ncbi:acyltransferase family protein [Francisella philomiragia]|uniref:acyltransferase family protein n=1 Tax=Francisella philomiragia TaxID=28110 RepID=UPI001F3FDD7E|nr:acyltransferase family protein [Francisella philomiragia]
MKYYKHIDGLRAVAVLSVVFFHLDINLVKSGFLGVDIFFVISGFLITGIIIRDLENKSFSLRNFYLRRMRRILPALITVLIFSTIFAWLILLPQDLKNYSKSLVSALGSFSNLYFFKTLSFGYFSTDATVIPLLHTWSLGIEEQFYIFWPLFLIFAFNVYIGIGWKDKQALSNFDKYLIISLILIVLSLFCFRYFSYFEIYDYFNHERFYYFPLTRAFELLFGCVLAIYLTKYKPTNNKLILELLSIISILLMLYPVLFKDVSYPSNWTVIACVGAVLYIYAGCNEKYNTLVNRFLSIKPIVFIGLISYSLYLWHWPIIAYLNYLSIEKTHLVKLVVLIVSIVLATLTYLFVEKPFRYKFKVSFKKTLIILWIIPIAIACCFALGSKYINNFGFNHKSKYDSSQLNFSYGFKEIDINNCFTMNSTNKFSSKQLPSPDKCTIGNNIKANNTNILFIGDSHVRSEIPMLDVWLKNKNVNAYTISQRSTPFIVGMPEIEKGVSMIDRNNSLENLIKTHKYKYVILGGFWSADGYKSFIANIDESISFIIKNKSIPIVILDTPELPENFNPLCENVTPRFLLMIYPHHCQIIKSYVLNQQKSFLAKIYKLKHKYKELILINPKKVICNKDYCNTSLNGIPIYADNHHLNFIGSKLLGERYLKEYGNPLNSLDLDNLNQ